MSFVNWSVGAFFQMNVLRLITGDKTQKNNRPNPKVMKNDAAVEIEYVTPYTPTPIEKLKTMSLVQLYKHYMRLVFPFQFQFLFTVCAGMI